MWNLIPLLFIALLALPAPVAAQATPPQQLAHRHTVLLECVREIRRHTTGGEFHAYITLRGDIRTRGGNDGDDAQLGKCLSRRGLTAPAKPARAD